MRYGVYLIIFAGFFASLTNSFEDKDIQTQYQQFLKKTPQQMATDLGQSVEFVKSLSPAVRFVVNLKQSMDKASQDMKTFYAQMIAKIIARGAGVGGVSQRPATEQERYFILKALHGAVNQGVTEKDLGLNAPSLTGHQTFVSNFVKNAKYSFSVQQEVFGDGLADKALIGKFGNIEVTHQYNSDFPTAPIIHPYNLDDTVQDQKRMFIPLRIKLPIQSYYWNLPENVLQAIQQIPSDKLDLFFIAQNNVWKREADLLYRPHYWVFPNAPAYGNFNQGFSAKITFLPVPFGTTISHQHGPFADGGFSVHPGEDGRVVSSGVNCSIENLIQGKKNQSLAFFSLIECNSRYALTLHWLLTENDETHLKNINHGRRNNKTLGGWAQRIAQDPALNKLYTFVF